MDNIDHNKSLHELLLSASFPTGFSNEEAAIISSYLTSKDPSITLSDVTNRLRESHGVVPIDDPRGLGKFALDVAIIVLAIYLSK